MSDMVDIEKRMNGAIDSFKHNLVGLRTGRANAALVDNLKVEVYGSMMPLNQIASITIPEPRTITISVWDLNNAPTVEKAILASSLGLNPNREGAVIRLNLPDLTEERRKELVKVASGYAENAKIAVRNVRRDGIDQAKKDEKDGSISEDGLRTLSEQIQKLTDKFVETIDKLYSDKEAEIMKV